MRVHKQNPGTAGGGGRTLRVVNGDDHRADTGAGLVTVTVTDTVIDDDTGFRRPGGSVEPPDRLAGL